MSSRRANHNQINSNNNYNANYNRSNNRYLRNINCNTNAFNSHNNNYTNNTTKFSVEDVANRFKDYIIKSFDIRSDTVTKLDKSRVKQIYQDQFPNENQGFQSTSIPLNILFYSL